MTSVSASYVYQSHAASGLAFGNAVLTSLWAHTQMHVRECEALRSKASWCDSAWFVCCIMGTLCPCVCIRVHTQMCRCACLCLCIFDCVCDCVCVCLGNEDMQPIRAGTMPSVYRAGWSLPPFHPPFPPSAFNVEVSDPQGARKLNAWMAQQYHYDVLQRICSFVSNPPPWSPDITSSWANTTLLNTFLFLFDRFWHVD